MNLLANFILDNLKNDINFGALSIRPKQSTIGSPIKLQRYRALQLRIGNVRLHIILPFFICEDTSTVVF